MPGDQEAPPSLPSQHRCMVAPGVRKEPCADRLSELTGAFPPKKDFGSESWGSLTTQSCSASGQPDPRSRVQQSWLQELRPTSRWQPGSPLPGLALHLLPRPRTLRILREAAAFSSSWQRQGHTQAGDCQTHRGQPGASRVLTRWTARWDQPDDGPGWRGRAPYKHP